MLFQNTIDALDLEVRELQAQIEALNQRQNELIQLDAVAESAFETLSEAVRKIQCSAPNAIATLKSAVLGLFGTDGDGGNQPIDPTPATEEDGEPLRLCFNGITGDCATSADLEIESKPHPHKEELDGRTYEWASPLACLVWEDAPRLGQHCQFACYWVHDWELEPLDGQAWEIATPLCCLLSEKHNENKDTNEVEGMAYAELISHSENEVIAYLRKHDGEIICTYLGFRTKALASSWLRAVEVLTSAVELRQAKRLESVKWEIKAKGLNINQINRLAAEDLTKTYRVEIGSAKPPAYKAPQCKLPVHPNVVEPGDIVTPLLAPADSYEVIQVMPNGILDCKSLRTGINMGIRPDAVSLVQKALATNQKYWTLVRSF
jgi:hypothetical protein